MQGMCLPFIVQKLRKSIIKNKRKYNIHVKLVREVSKKKTAM